MVSRSRDIYKYFPDISAIYFLRKQSGSFIETFKSTIRKIL